MDGRGTLNADGILLPAAAEVLTEVCSLHTGAPEDLSPAAGQPKQISIICNRFFKKYFIILIGQINS